MGIVGEKAPEFTLEGFYKGELKSFSLEEFRGKWTVLLFYPLDFTFVCPTEVLEFSRNADLFQEIGAQLLGISVDSQFTHKAWVETDYDKGGLGGDLNYPLLSDLNKNIAAAYGVLDENAGVALRGLFIIDPEGVVMHATINNLPVGRSVNETLRSLKAFQYVASHEGEVCPANWEEGQETMSATAEGMHRYLSEHSR